MNLFCFRERGMDNSSLEQRLISSDEEGDLKRRIIEESEKIWRVAGPGVIARVSSYGALIVTQLFIGHIGSAAELSGYALVQSILVQFVNGIMLGMSSAMETLCGQSYGAKQYHMMGIYLQRSWIVDLITVTIVLPAFIFATPFFNLIGEEAGVAKAAGHVSLWFIPYVYGLVFTMTMQMFLQAQQKNYIVACLTPVQLAIHVLVSWLFVYVLDFGVSGAMASLCISIWFVVGGEFLYVFGGWCPETWKGFTIAAAKDLVPVVKLSVSSGLMICLELWYYAILVLLAGYMKNAAVAISAFSICFNITAWILMITFGLMAAACVRVANELGRGDAKATKFSITVLLSTSSLLGLVFCILCSIFYDKIGYLFTNDVEVAEAVTDLTFLLSFTVLLGSIFPILSGVAIGAGLQSKVAVVNLVCLYCVGLSVGAILGYVVHLQVKGIWIGLTCGMVTQTMSLIFMVWRTNWDEEVSKTLARLERWYLNNSH